MTVFLEERFAELLAHRRIDGDDVNNAIVDAFVGTLAERFERLGLIAFGDDDGTDGSRMLTDPSVAPDWALRHAALYTGAALPGRAADEDIDAWLARARDAAVYPLGIKRGTHEAVRRTVQPLLTGTKSVFISDNYGGDYDIYVRTVVAETPDPALVQRRLEGDFVSGGEPGAIRSELRLTYLAADYVAWPEATLTWSAVADGVTWTTATRGDLT